MTSMIHYQDCTSPCPNPSCSSGGKKATVAYRLSSSGPWVLEKNMASCSECGQVYRLSIEILPSGIRASSHCAVEAGPRL